MTYRMLGGLGADEVVTPETIGAFMKAFLNVGGCTPSIQKNMIDTIPCLNSRYFQLDTPCFSGEIPPGITPVEFSQACVQMQKCGMFTKPGCTDMEPSTKDFPPCMPASEFKPLVDYCGSHPNWDGPDKNLNVACWAMSRFPNYYSRVMNMQVCPAPAPPPPSAAPAPPPPVVYQAPPPAPTPAAPVYQAPPPAPAAPPVVYQTAPPSQATPSESTPSSMYNPEPSYSDESLPPSAEASTTSTASMAMWGLLGVAVLGGGYLLLRKK
jgi:hypothetical protein